MRAFLAAALFGALIQPAAGLAQDMDSVEWLESPESPPPLWFDFPVIDSAFNFDPPYTFPSMRQSLALSTDFYQGVHLLIAGDQGPFPGFWRRFAIIGFDALVSWVPLSNTWLHEEWHRAVMSSHGISSYNDVYKFPIGATTVAVSHVADEDLIRLKRDHPADQVRLSAAGLESQAEQNLLIERRHFFEGARTFDRGLLLLNYLNNWFYLSLCASGEADTMTDEQNANDGQNLTKRDFTGLDCTAWAYDLFRPYEPYTARGPHPSGVGINRYRKYSDLSGEEQEFLRRQVALNTLNFLDPFLLGFERFHGRMGGESFLWNATLRHHLTSFGFTIDANIFVDTGYRKLLLKLHNQFNDVRYFPGLTLELHRQPLPFRDFNLSATVSVWQQPRDQYVRASEAEAGGAAGLRLGWRLGSLTELYAGAEAKTPGWVAGNVYTGQSVSALVGFNIGVAQP